MPKKSTGPPTEDDMARELKIKVNVVKRMQKEVASYEKEATQQEAKVAKMKEDGRDAYDIKKQEEVLQESYMMIPDSKTRLKASLEDLEAFLIENGDVPSVQSSEFYEEATALTAQLGAEQDAS